MRLLTPYRKLAGVSASVIAVIGINATDAQAVSAPSGPVRNMFHTAFSQGQTTHLMSMTTGSKGDNEGVIDYSGSMYTGLSYWTSPSIAKTAVAFKIWNGDLAFWTQSRGFVDTGLPVWPGTSPSIAQAPDGPFRIAYENANDGNLHEYIDPTGAGVLPGWPGGGYDTNTWYGMQNSSSPSIANLTDGSWEVAFTANTGHLWIVGATHNLGDNGWSAKPGTTPSIAASPSGGYRVAMQGLDGNLWVYDDTTGWSQHGSNLDPSSSPGITAIGGSWGGWEYAYQSADHFLHMTGWSTWNPGWQLEPGTSPSIAAAPLAEDDFQWEPVWGYQVAFTGSNGNLDICQHQQGCTDSGQTMSWATSPSIGRTSETR